MYIICAVARVACPHKSISTLGVNHRRKNLPFFFIKLGGFFGDFLNLFKINFPLNSFRVKNMTTNNIIPCALMNQFKNYPKISVDEGIKSTLRWINNSDN